MLRPQLKPEERIILALDFPEHEIAINWVEKLRSKIKTFKVGSILFLDSGSEGLKEFSNLSVEVFLDLKFHDIPSTVEITARQSVRFGANMFTIHTLGGFEMMKRTSEAVKEEAEKLSYPKPLVLGVTVLTSHDKKSLEKIGISTSTEDTVMNLAALAEKANIDGLVCSGVEVEALRKEFGDRFTLVVPGIRPGTANHDQKRVTTPEEAISAGADYLVIGRAITEADNPEEIVDEIVTSIS
ncbi:MAG: orotidine-5'-phosphate decarboxylase [Deltaproteobacteria bacterium]|nr:orotidine-5'-phosphate decarboxylase [Deltaproteobacteria bacterium]MCK5708907.1 orotidine-5'-phosphate decarboxylase [Deltaproteobacteria bacterium]